MTTTPSPTDTGSGPDPTFAASQSSPVARSSPFGLQSGVGSAWQPIETAPLDGTAIQARIPGHGEDNIIAWVSDALYDEDEQPCGSWSFVTEQEPPDCWTDGWCLASNEDDVRSAWPTHWKPLQEDIAHD
jgi:hypothetical protein